MQVSGGHGGGPSASAQTVSQGGGETAGDTALVANLQYNSPMAMYSGENVVEALHGQTSGHGHVSSIVG